ncbi:tRNA (adenosine(37)-N6)-threonylcarbamoyltransferase complex ATPase subunit type 1 TsaE [Sphingobium sp. B11D3D]|uniref:tRNA (adenosine(37)-N6)-threonylcarbamoyltransferase complex ATPase subunit type 1 TsaE n=1 Tax=Sphingobium sp. B11D3D TaxID=2940576 RepID=UPI002224BAF9|nr:tRNA (adenosine(37)-N6)-threonylcarbamoyltransferase complex ATPase subunit type 1 TsaE [Sphingobium sp. B11D3D]MCW2369649.1 tRNA threonylcarbamoyladenosine biosynthesis protein TsaE [Sphingobium sp. B11D3D]
MSDHALFFSSADALADFGAALGAKLRPGDVITLTGGLGAGKTTLARGLLRGLGHEGDVPSPTFAILQGYEPPETRLPVGHVDLYRIEDTGDLSELGLDEWLEDGALAIEWPDRLAGRYNAIALALQIDILADGTRRLTARVPRVWESRWPVT